MNNQRARNRAMAAVGIAVAAVGLMAASIGVATATGHGPTASTLPPAEGGVVRAEAPVRGAATEVAVAVEVEAVEAEAVEAESVEVQSVEAESVGSTPIAFDRLVLVGDSLADESAPVIALVAGDVPVVRKHWGGTAPCDWLDDDLEATATSVVVITFTGNNLTPCMIDEAGEHLSGPRLVDKYRADVGMLVERARAAGAWVVLVGQPNHHPRLGVEGQIAGINAAYRELAEQLPMVVFVDGGAAVEAADGSYTDRLPCTALDMDCDAHGTTVVRGDGVHFCPVVGVNPCPVWSSGAMRYGMTIAAAALDPQRLD